MPEIIIDIEDQAPPENALLIFPRPLAEGLQDYQQLRLEGVSDIHEVRAVHSRQRAFIASPNALCPNIRYKLNLLDGEAPPWLFDHAENRYTQASNDLVKEACLFTSDASNEAECAERLIKHAATLFEYDHPEQRFNEGMDSMPTICGTAKGSCVDMHGYVLAAARSCGLSVQYIAGYWFHPDRNFTRDMHCWLAFRLDGQTVFWDLAHHLKWDVPELAPGLNPAGGRRVIMSYGRGNQFETPFGTVEFSHFSEPEWILPDGSTQRPELTIRIIESDD